MSKYILAKVNISEDQGKKLLSGKGVRLAHGCLAGDQELALTSMQAKRMAKAMQSGKGMILRFSDAQASHHAKKGSGFFSKIGRFFKKAGKAIYKKVVKPVAKFGLSLPGVRQAVDAAVKQGSQVVGSTVGALTGNAELGNKVAAVGESVGNKVVNTVGSGRRRGASSYSPFVGTPLMRGSGNDQTGTQGVALMPFKMGKTKVIVRRPGVVRSNVVAKAVLPRVKKGMAAAPKKKAAAKKGKGVVLNFKPSLALKQLKGMPDFMGSGVMALSSTRGRGIAKGKPGQPQGYDAAVNSRSRFLL